MIETLFNKINEWTFERALEFHGGTELSIDYIWEWNDDSTGIYLTSPDGAFYMDNRAGIVYRLHSRHSPNDYNILSNLSRINIDTTNEVRFDHPVDHSILDRDGIEWEYTVYHRPNRELGAPFSELIRDLDNIDETLLKYIKFTEDTIEIFLDLNVNFPVVGLTISQIAIDKIGYFWINLKNFDLGYEEFLLKTLYEFKRVLNDISKTTGKDMSEYLTIAENSWRK
jgi:hypothetical protein